MRLHPLPIPGSGSGSNSNQILPTVGGANLPNAHFTNAFSSKVGGITGYEGAGGSAAALAGNPGYKIFPMKGGLMRRAGARTSKRRCKCCRSNKTCNCRSKKSCKCRSKKTCKCSCHRSRRRMLRGGGDLSATAAAFHGANLPYHQYMGGIPNSPGFSVGGSNAPLPHSAMANPPPITGIKNCEK